MNNKLTHSHCVSLQMPLNSTVVLPSPKSLNPRPKQSSNAMDSQTQPQLMHSGSSPFRAKSTRCRSTELMETLLPLTPS
ncbi:hypothetical protein CAPTEDRAFT_225305 [Capitella teleta]|uniref:Uncharacterized protein n=1 Tax=Capitella teleta TaxID=283909 RepID=R7T8N7_CAPTE|nr:hypothetical protein CAPTEDRAFT_225305 [Capitella teleta]|eukprot:ELT90000.1 hypothetical protein CAPTEDRAFT_225305 [Capitella teleta]